MAQLMIRCERCDSVYDVGTSESGWCGVCEEFLTPIGSPVGLTLSQTADLLQSLDFRLRRVAEHGGPVQRTPTPRR